MNQKKFMKSRSLRYGGISTALTALIIVGVLLVNVIVSALGEKLLWYSDLTPELLFTLSDEMVTLMEEGDETYNTESPIQRIDTMRQEKNDPNLSVRIIFCNTKDAWQQDSSLLLYISQTAEQLAKKFDGYITVEYVDSIKNKSFFDPFTVASETISTTDVIIACGNEYRIRSYDQFFQTDSGETTPWAYKGEIVFASAILATTRVDNPMVCFTVGHGEEVFLGVGDYAGTELAQEYGYLYSNLVEEAGFDVRTVDLSKEEIPPECRLVIIYNPQSDFKNHFTQNVDDEIEKLDAFLANEEGRSLMAFVSPDTEPLTYLEEYLETWGIVFDRTDGISHVVRDVANSAQGDTTGLTIQANYVTGSPVSSLFDGMGASSVTMFENAMPISYAQGITPTVYPPAGEESEDGLYYTYGSGTVNMKSREVYTLLETDTTAKAYAGNILKEANTAFPLMTVSTLPRTFSTGDSLLQSSADASSFVYACGSVEFTRREYLAKNVYSNGKVLLSALKVAGEVEVAHGLVINPFAELEISTITTGAAWTWTLVLTILPAVVATGAGIFVLIRRKYR